MPGMGGEANPSVPVFLKAMVSRRGPRRVSCCHVLVHPFTTEFADSRMLQCLATPSEAELKVFFKSYIPSACAAYANVSTIWEYDNHLVQQFSTLSMEEVISTTTHNFQIDEKLPHHNFVIRPGQICSQHIIEFASQ